MKKVDDLVIKPTIAGLHKEGIDYKGFIFVGLMNVGGHPYVIEYNARMGDPETQAVMTRIKNDFLELLVAAASGDLKDKKVEIDDQYAVTIVQVSGGYPGTFEKGKAIRGHEKDGRALVFHAGTKRTAEAVVSDGGRVLAITGKGHSLTEAREAAYARAGEISWEGLYFRDDIGLDLLNYHS